MVYVFRGVHGRRTLSPAMVGGQPRAHADGGLHAQPRRRFQQRRQLRVLLQDDDAVDAQLPPVEHLRWGRRVIWLGYKT